MPEPLRGRGDHPDRGRHPGHGVHGLHRSGPGLQIAGALDGVSAMLGAWYDRPDGRRHDGAAGRRAWRSCSDGRIAPSTSRWTRGSQQINEALPGANCGGCGYVGCNEYAEAVAGGGVSVNLCTVGGQSCAEDLAEIMGVEVTESWPLPRRWFTAALTIDVRLGRNLYLGEATCSAANVISGVQGCTYGCLGLGDCVTACDYDAIHMIERPRGGGLRRLHRVRGLRQGLPPEHHHHDPVQGRADADRRLLEQGHGQRGASEVCKDRLHRLQGLRQAQRRHHHGRQRRR